MDDNFKKIENFHDPDPVLSSVDLIAVKTGLKRVARIQCGNQEELKKYRPAFRRHGLVFACSDEKLLGKHDIYISGSKKLAAAAKKTDPSYKIINQKKTFNEVIDSVREFSFYLSYPECCVEEYLKNVLTSKSVGEAVIFKKIPEKIDFVMNNLLHGASNYFLSFHFPCSWHCKKSLKYQRQIFQAVQKESPKLAQKINYYLARPFLVFLDPALGNMYVSWDNRRGFVFEGAMTRSGLSYVSAVDFRTNYPDYQKNIGEQFRTIRSSIIAGNRLIRHKKGVKVYKGNKQLYDFMIPGLISMFFNFK